MIYTWRCPKCSRYLSQIEIHSKSACVNQKTICPRCKSENKISLNYESVIISCGFSRKFMNNLVDISVIKAPKIEKRPVDNFTNIVYSIARVTVIKDKKDSS